MAEQSTAELIAEGRDRAKTDSPAHELIKALADALERVTVPSEKPVWVSSDGTQHSYPVAGVGQWVFPPVPSENEREAFTLNDKARWSGRHALLTAVQQLKHHSTKIEAGGKVLPLASREIAAEWLQEFADSFGKGEQ